MKASLKSFDGFLMRVSDDWVGVEWDLTGVNVQAKGQNTII